MASDVKQKTQGTDPYVLRKQHRLVTVWSTNLVDTKGYAQPESFQLTDAFHFGRYSQFIQANEKHLPSLIGVENLSASNISLNDNSEVELSDSRLMVLKLPNQHILIALEIFVEDGLKKFIDIMQDCYYKRLKIKGESIESWLLANFSLAPESEQVFDEAYYQFVSLSEPEADEDIDYQKVRSVIYRYVDDGLAYREQFREKANDEFYPPALNIRKRSLCAVSNYVSVVYNHQEYIESTMILSILQYVAAQQSLTSLRERSFNILQDLNEQAFNGVTADEELPKLIRTAKHLELLNLELSLSVEEPMDLSLILPSLRSQAYHQALFDVSNTDYKVENLGRMLMRIENVLTSNKSMMESYEQEKSSLRSRVWAVIASSISLIAIPVTIILAFFSAPVEESPKGASLFDLQMHWRLYASVFGAFLMSFLLGGVIWSSIQVKKHRKRRKLFEDVQSLMRRGKRH